MTNKRRTQIKIALDLLVPLSLVFMFLSGVQFIFINVIQVLFDSVLRADLFTAAPAVAWALIALTALYASFLIEDE